jgi:hypothetical protein
MDHMSVSHGLDERVVVAHVADAGRRAARAGKIVAPPAMQEPQAHVVLLASSGKAP